LTGSLPGSFPGNFLSPLTLVIGGARSGKSAFAEGLVVGSGRPRRYIATAQAWDDEMRARIARHRQDRGAGWTTIEAPLDLCAALADAQAHEAVLVDCATLWLTNHLLAEHDLAAEGTALLSALAACAAPVVIVSNETGWGIVPDNALARRFRDAQGRLNQRLAARADLVVTVIAGLPLALKGNLP
jgi:adenosylcobinamide kinase/adenosylcobinamide-phosphate guanylyltransferase